jgi:hypothetical protein
LAEQCQPVAGTGILAGSNLTELSLIEPLRLGCGPIREREQSRDGEEDPSHWFPPGTRAPETTVPELIL